MEILRVAQKVRRAILGVAGAVWVAALGFNAILDNAYVNYPRVPNAEIGRTIPYEVKRIVVYVTEGQATALNWLSWLQIGSGAVILISLILTQKWPFGIEDRRA
jgi:hypothetical protein